MRKASLLLVHKTPLFFGKAIMRFSHPLLYFLNADRIVLPISSLDDYDRSLIEKNAFFLGTKEQQMHPIEFGMPGKIEENEKMVIDELHKKEKVYPDHPVLAPDLNSLAIIYLAQKKLNDAQSTIERAVKLEQKNIGGLTDPLPRLTNLGILHYLNGNQKYCADVFEFCVGRWLDSKRELDISALPYFYNLLAINDNKDTKFLKETIAALALIYPKLNNEHPFYQVFDVLWQAQNTSKNAVVGGFLKPA